MGAGQKNFQGKALCMDMPSTYVPVDYRFIYIISIYASLAGSPKPPGNGPCTVLFSAPYISPYGHSPLDKWKYLYDIYHQKGALFHAEFLVLRGRLFFTLYTSTF